MRKKSKSARGRNLTLDEKLAKVISVNLRMLVLT